MSKLDLLHYWQKEKIITDKKILEAFKPDPPEPDPSEKKEPRQDEKQPQEKSAGTVVKEPRT